MTEYEIKRLENRIRELWNEKEDLMKEKEELENQNRLLGERCNQLLKDKGELTDKIADIKANCDLAIEGRDIKIKELELELTVEKDLLQEETNLHLHAEEYIKSLEEDYNKLLDVINNQDVKIANLKEQVQSQVEATIELDKENAELKEELKDANEKVVHLACNQNKDLKYKLTKAKELLKQWVELFKPKGGNIPPTPIQVDTEQFLKEIEKMTDEEMANRFREDLVCSTKRLIGRENYEYIEQAFLAGLKAGRPQWHDLRENPNDLPKEDENYICLLEEGHKFECYYDPTTKKWYDNFFHQEIEYGYYQSKVIAWCEIPTFDKE